MDVVVVEMETRAETWCRWHVADFIIIVVVVFVAFTHYLTPSPSLSAALDT